MQRHALYRLLTEAVCALFLSTPLLAAAAVSMTDYTNYPVFMNQTVPPNVLFIVDMGNQTIQAAYAGTGHQYPVSFKSGTVIAEKYASNVTLTAAGGGGASLVAVDAAGAALAGATSNLPADVFSSTKSYYGLFDPLRCYLTNSTSFTYGSVKSAVSSACGSTQWDGNFLNWLAMRKKDVAYQALVGGTSKPASANTDGTANSLAGEDVTGEDGTNNTCSTSSKPCWRYVKFAPAAALVARVPVALPNPAVTGAVAGRFFGSGEGKIYVNDNTGADPFDTANGNVYKLQVDLTSEPDIPSGTGSAADSCLVGSATYAGHRVCYMRERSLGLFQTLRTDNMRVAVMFANALSLQGGKMVYNFDDHFNASSITQLRNEHIQTGSPISEALYEGLCLYRKSQGPCYSNSGQSSVNYTNAVGVASDPFYSVSSAQMVSCCKSFILMISPGVGTGDGNAPDLQQPFGNLFTGTDIGVATPAGGAGRMDDIALYGHTHDVRDQTAPAAAVVSGKQTVTFYAVNAMGGSAGSGLLSSTAKYGGFMDRNGNNLPESTGQNCTYPAGSTLGSGASTSSLEWDANQDCVPDTYFEAADGGDLQAQINLALADILKRAASGTAVSVLATSSTGEGSLYQAFFYPSQFEGLTEIQWLGYLQGLFLDTFGNLREDHSGPNCSGKPDGRLVLEHDCIVKIHYDASTGEVKVDRYVDANGDGIPDSTTPLDTILLKDLQPIWEAGNRLAYTDPGDSCVSAQAGVTCRRILTWTDTSGDKLVQSAEVMEFTTANKSQLCPYLATASVLTCVSGGAAGAGQTEATNVIRFLRGEDGAGAIGGLRDRSLTIKNPDDNSSAKRVWKLGDIVNSTPMAVSTPRERYDVVYGDTSYSAFYQRYRARRTVVYVGANDGMLHAFNGGFFTANDDPSTSAVEHGYFTTTPPSGISTTRAAPSLGAELWAFVPQELLPHLKWFTQTDYTHVSYVDLKPRVTDARIFTPDDDHPNGWGTVLIIGMRLGGSCAGCSSPNGGTPMTVTADFAGSGTTTTRTFYSTYVALDVTNPEKDPTILWVFTDSTLGLTTSTPAFLRVNPSTDAPTDNTNAVWMAIFGSGPTGYTGASSQTAKFYGVNLHSGPVYAASGAFAGPIFNTLDANSFTGDLTSVDLNLTYRVNVIYGGTTISTGLSNPKWAGKLYRLTTSGSTNTSLWGISGTGSARAPTALISSYAYSGIPAPCGTSSPCRVGPITAAPAVAMDDKGNLWVIFGTGRYWEAADKTNTELQAFFGIKDTFITAGAPAQTTEHNSLLNVSGIVICTAGLGCSPTSNVSFDNGASYTTGLTLTPPGGPLNLVAQIQAVDGWVTSQPAAGERSLTRLSVMGGTVFATSFIPSPDLCSASGTGSLYALYYMSGTGYYDAPLGTQTIGSTTVAVREVSLGEGMPSAPAYQLGGQGQGMAGSNSSSSSNGGCNSRLSIFVQSSTGALNQVCGKAALSLWSRVLSWRSL